MMFFDMKRSVQEKQCEGLFTRCDSLTKITKLWEKTMYPYVCPCGMNPHKDASKRMCKGFFLCACGFCVCLLFDTLAES